MIGQTLGSFRVVEKLGEGGMGTVYRAIDELLDRDVALKVLRPELAHRPATVDRFRAEAITLAKLDHPAIARIHGFSRHGDCWFIVMELVRGVTLFGRLGSAGRLSWREALPLVTQLLDALEYAHALGVIHRDVKPANVLVRPDGRVKVTDFGIARVLGTARATRTGHIVGTLDYMAPEQIRGEDVDARADLYAVGILLFEVLTGRVPYRGSSEYDLITQHLQAPVPSARTLAADVPPWCDEILQRALAKTSRERFDSAAEFRSALEAGGRFEATGARESVPKPTRLAVDPSRELPPPTRLAGAVASSPPGAASPTSRHTVLASLPIVGDVTWRQLIAAAALIAVIVTVPLAVTRWLSRERVVPLEASSATPASRPAPLEVPAGAAGPVPPAVERRDSFEPPPTSHPPPPLRTIGGTPSRPAPGDRPSRPGPAPDAPPPDAGKTPPPVGEPAAPAAPRARAAELEPVEFEDVMLVTMDGEKNREQAVVLRFESDRLVLKDADSEQLLRTVAYSEITAATYARSRQPKWQGGKSGIVRGLARSVSFLKATGHWLTIEGPALILKLDGDGFEEILPALEARADLRIERVSEK